MGIYHPTSQIQIEAGFEVVQDVGLLVTIW